MAAKTPIITLLTDYGTRDHFVASMKAVMYGIIPDINIVDISHDVAPQDLIEAAFLLRCCYKYFPYRTIHTVVVDPTVGSNRRPILVATENFYFIAPDNGVLSLIYDVETLSTVVEITSEHYLMPEISKTFHGRDVFAPAAAWLAKGIDILNFGDPIEDYLKLSIPKPKMVGEGLLKGSVIHIDRFGNCITNITRQDFEAAQGKNKTKAARVVIGKQEITGLKEYYAEGQRGELMALFGSSDFLEVAQTQESAAKSLSVTRGAEVGVLLK